MISGLNVTLRKCDVAATRFTGTFGSVPCYNFTYHSTREIAVSTVCIKGLMFYVGASKYICIFIFVRPWGDAGNWNNSDLTYSTLLMTYRRKRSRKKCWNAVQGLQKILNFCIILVDHSIGVLGASGLPCNEFCLSRKWLADITNKGAPWREPTA